jgi:UDP-N-acetylglucosamine 4,6-dehydratase
MFKNKRVLITGGTGSFGNALLQRLVNEETKEIRILSRDEKKQDDMRRRYASPKIKFYIGDVREPTSVREACDGADFLFHAAALKQVPSCEFYPIEAVRTNVLGTENVLQSALECRVGRVVVLSTDKAAYPINAMGMSKALMEKVMVAKSRLAERKGLIFCATRYGNVMASRGSVIPLFLEQLAAGKPLTITDPNMTRFMMSLNAAVDLVLYAFEYGQSGDLFVQKAPAATLATLAAALCRLLDRPYATQTIGTRHGEKLYETLLTREEMSRAEDLGGYYRVPSDGRDLNYGLYFSEGKSVRSELQDYHSHNTQQLNVEEMINLLTALPEVKSFLDPASHTRT